MEGLDRLVSESLARYGFTTSVDHRRLRWSKWFRCESSFSLLLVPGKAGLFALGEEMIAPGEIPATGGKRMLALYQISEAEDLGMALGRLFFPGSPHLERFASGRCFARYAVIEDAQQRQAALAAFEKWLPSSAEAVSGIGGDMPMQTELAAASSQAVATASDGPEQARTEPPAALPSGF
jgi:hypothetical protein